MLEHFSCVFVSLKLPHIGYLSTNSRETHMDTIETLEIAELEYDVAGAGAVETADSQVNHAAYAICFR